MTTADTDISPADPYSVLGPDEVQIKSSRRHLKTNDGLLTDVITGEVLVSAIYPLRSQADRYLGDKKSLQIANRCSKSS